MGADTMTIPGPPAWPLFGNVLQFNADNPTMTMEEWAQKYGEIYRIQFPWGPVYVVSSQALVNECCDESRFKKNIRSGLLELQNGVNNGIFTSDTNDPQWGLAHRILTPAFGPASINGMFSEMHEIASQLALKWARHGSDTPIMVTDDFTRLTLDTIALCSMGYRFNSYYHDQLHPFISAMTGFLVESGDRFIRPWFMKPFARSATKKFFADIALLRKTAQDVLDARKNNPTGRKDLMSAMLEGVDPKTGKKLTDSAIIDNLITFLIAGHETTSGMLSFAFYELIKHQDKFKKAQEEVDRVVGRGPILLEHMSKLPYVSAVLKETLRLCPTITAIEVEPKGDQVMGGGKYYIPDGSDIFILVSSAHRDPRVHGDTADRFMPERMLDESYDKINKEYPNFWKPFGNGQRGCIGRAFAMQESVLIMAMLLQNFDFRLNDERYELQYLETLTVKPKNFWMRASLRHGQTATDLQLRLSGGTVTEKTNGVARAIPTTNSRATLRPMNIYYGSNQGTSESLAHRLAMDAPTHGYTAAVIEPLDKAKDSLPTDRPIIIITASYEGEPPDNATSFCGWIKSLKGNELAGVSYAVFGCGHRDWSTTFHRVPKLVDETLEVRAGTRICELGSTDVSQSEMFTDFEQWEDNILWPAIEAKYGPVEGIETAESTLEISFSTPRASTLRQDVKEGVVIDAKLLTSADAEVPKRHIEIKLPEGVTYRAGDYLAVLPVNSKESVDRVMRHFGLARDSHITISGDGKTALPTGVPVPIHEVLGSYVELSQPVTKRGIQTLLKYATSPSTESTLSSLLSTPSLYTSAIITPRTSLLNLLSQHPSISLPFSTFLSLLPPLRPRLYSISSSPLHSPSTVSLTYSLLQSSQTSSGNAHLGVATSHLSSLLPGDILPISVKQSHVSFHLPTRQEISSTPIIMIAAGAGIAPFRGFIQELAVMHSQGIQLPSVVLYYGCRSASQDDLYRDELDEYQEKGVVKVRRAYSREPAGKKKQYVGDVLWEDRAQIKKLWDEGGKAFVCGSRSVGEGVKKVLGRLVLGDDVGEGQVKGWFDGVRNLRVAVDVFD